MIREELPMSFSFACIFNNILAVDLEKHNWYLSNTIYESANVNEIQYKELNANLPSV